MISKNKNKGYSEITYDVIILGGGIAGLYALYKLSQKHPDWHILLLEKEKQLGGRISTYKKNGIVLERGAGRFNDSHPLLIQLIQELHLQHKVRKTSTDVVYMPDSQGEYHPLVKKGLWHSIYQMVLGDGEIELEKLIIKVVIASYFDSKETMLQKNFIQYARGIMNREQVQYIVNAFGYYKELHDMNAYNCIQLMKMLSPLNHNYVMTGGLSTLIERLVENILRNKNAMILTENEVRTIRTLEDGIFEVGAKETLYSCHRLICALPREALIRFPIFSSIRTRLLDKINSGSLCRIYSRFPRDASGKYWFQDLPKITTNNVLRMVIPYDLDKGIVMISYTDSHFADSWYRLYRSKGMLAMNRKIRRLVKEITAIDIPRPLETHIFYWASGVGYWGIGADGAEISSKILKPFESQSLYICGENYSGDYQQWIEGALETSEKVVDLC